MISPYLCSSIHLVHHEVAIYITIQIQLVINTINHIMKCINNNNNHPLQFSINKFSPKDNEKTQRFITIFFSSFSPFRVNYTCILYLEDYNRHYSMTFSDPESNFCFEKIYFDLKKKYLFILLNQLK
jgi:hypothetical protein